VVNEKNNAKTKDPQKYKELNSEVQKMLRKDNWREYLAWVLWGELESASAIGNVRKLYGAVRSVTGKFQPCLHCIESASGEIVTETNEILRVSRTARKTNEWILEKAGVTRTLLASIKTTKLRYFGHIMRHNCIEKDISSKYNFNFNLVRLERHFDVRHRPASDDNGRQKCVLTNEIADLLHEYS